MCEGGRIAGKAARFVRPIDDPPARSGPSYGLATTSAMAAAIASTSRAFVLPRHCTKRASDTDLTWDASAPESLERLTLALQRHEETPPNPPPSSGGDQEGRSPLHQGGGSRRAIPPFVRGGSRGAIPPSSGGDQQGRTPRSPPLTKGGSGGVEASARPPGRTTSAIHSLTAPGDRQELRYLKSAGSPTGPTRRRGPPSVPAADRRRPAAARWADRRSRVAPPGDGEVSVGSRPAGAGRSGRAGPMAGRRWAADGIETNWE